jgi:uncharacterized membrane protein YhaH (DUF805 family)
MSSSATEAIGHWLKALIGFRYRIGPLKYLLGLMVALGFLLFAIGTFVQATMDPAVAATGNSTPTAFALAAFAWVHAAITTNRLRDAAAPWWVYAVTIGGPYVLMALAILIQAIFFIPALVIIPLMFATPLIFPRRPDLVETP